MSSYYTTNAIQGNKKPAAVMILGKNKFQNQTGFDLWYN